MIDTAFYYIRGEGNKPVVTVCIAFDPVHPEDIARGVAICSIDELPRKKKGRGIAYSRAKRALLSGEDVDPVRKACEWKQEKLLASLGAWGLEYSEVPEFTYITRFYKGKHSPKLTEFEESMIKNRRFPSKGTIE